MQLFITFYVLILSPDNDRLDHNHIFIILDSVPNMRFYTFQTFDFGHFGLPFPELLIVRIISYQSIGNYKIFFAIQ